MAAPPGLAISNILSSMGHAGNLRSHDDGSTSHSLDGSSQGGDQTPLIMESLNWLCEDSGGVFATLLPLRTLSLFNILDIASLSGYFAGPMGTLPSPLTSLPKPSNLLGIRDKHQR